MPLDKYDIDFDVAINLLQQLVSIPSISREEAGTADCLQQFIHARGIPVFRVANNVYCFNQYFDAAKPTILLNSHHDTVRPNSGFSRDPYDAQCVSDKLFGLGTTDAGASLVSLLSAFLHFYNDTALAYNLAYAATAEEEISGHDGIDLLFRTDAFSNSFVQPGSFAIIGEPTRLELAVAEKGLLVIDCEASGTAGHAALQQGVNAIYKATDAINWFRHFKFEKVSPLLGEVMMNVTSIATANTAHNVVPSSCKFVVDIRLNELYTHEEILSRVRNAVDINIIPRSTRLGSTLLDPAHPVVLSGLSLGKKIYGSPTMSDKALVPIPALKCGPGNSEQSHTPDEFILLDDFKAGIQFYKDLLSPLLKPSHS